MIGKLMGLASIGSSLANIALLQRFLGDIVSIIALTILSAMMTAMLLIGCFYGAYAGLTDYGLNPVVASVTVAGIALLLTALLIGLTVRKLRQLHELPKHLRAGIPPFSRTGTIVHAFLEEFMKQPSPMKK